MKASSILITITQITIALSAHVARPSADDERGTIKATELASSNKLMARDCWFGLAAPQANGAGLRPAMETVLGSRAVTTISARPEVLGMQAAERVTAALAAAVAE
ncbi:MAG: hypothetical protein LQ338_002783 [Usnochroma carphineum]|nr:MAG: hypothetical protein LQ338_002783 [Usnochroma carphineum]